MVKKKLHIRKERSQKRNNEAEFQIKQLTNLKNEAAKLACVLNKICEIQNDQLNMNTDIETDSSRAKENEISRLIDQGLKHVTGITEEAAKELFNKEPNKVGIAEFRDFIDGPREHKEEKINWLASQSESIQDEIKKIRSNETKREKELIQNFYIDDPKRTMRWYVKKEGSPACTIDKETIENEFSNRWKTDTNIYIHNIPK